MTDTQPLDARDLRLEIPPRLLRILLGGTVTASLLGALQGTIQGLRVNGFVKWQTVLAQSTDWLVLAPLALLTVYLARRFPIRGAGFRRNVPVHVAGSAAFCLGWSTSGVGIRRLLGEGMALTFLDEWTAWILFSLPFGFFAYFALLGTVHSFAYYVHGREQELRASRLSSQLADASLRALRAQLHPHFLFNTLNAISVLMRGHRVRAAEDMLDRLSDLLRQVLQTDAPHKVTLESELALIEKYLAIEEARFSDRLQVRFTIDQQAYQRLVPPFILQPLVENALRHGVAGLTGDAKVEIGVRRDGNTLELWVQDNGPGIPSTISEGIGLSNIKSRLFTLYGERASLRLKPVNGAGMIALIRLPSEVAP